MEDDIHGSVVHLVRSKLLSEAIAELQGKQPRNWSLIIHQEDGNVHIYTGFADDSITLSRILGDMALAQNELLDYFLGKPRREDVQ